MRPRDILAGNLKTLMGASRMATFADIIRESQGKITNGTLDRIRRAESATSVDNLEILAEVFGIQAWQLLVPGLRATLGADGMPEVYNLPDWPFDMVDRERYFALQEPQRAYVQGKLATAIEEREGPLGHDRVEQLASEAVLRPIKKSPPSARKTR